MAKKKQKKVTFVKGTMATIVWDERKSKPMAEFVDGLFTTSDELVVRVLSDLGYKTTDDYPLGPPPEGFEHQKTSLPPPKQLSTSIPSTLQDNVDPSPAKKPDKVRATSQKTKVGTKPKIKRRKKSA